MGRPSNTILAIVLSVASFGAGVWYTHGGLGTKASGDRRVLYYRDPMHPAYTSDKPGIAPDCGMQLEPVYADGEKSAPAGARELPPGGTVTLALDKQQLMGVKVQTVESGSGPQTFRALGRVAPDETRVFRVVAAIDGSVRTTGPISVGSIVSKDELLATFYSREFLTAQQSYLYALNTMDRFKDNEGDEQLKVTSAQLRAAEENLEFLGMGHTQMQEIARTRQTTREIEIRAPVAGLVLARGVFPGTIFDRGAELFRIADLNHIWIFADVFEKDAQLLGSAGSAVVRYRDRTFPASRSDTLPQFDPASRALKLRLEMDNPLFLLRPDMFVDVDFALALQNGISVPTDAVIDSGLHKTVYVERESGAFEPRHVETGWRLGDHVQITKGLAPGERIVVSGNFLIDSESRMKLAAAGAPAPTAGPATAEKDPVCGMDVDPKAPNAIQIRSGDKTLTFCSAKCKKDFEASPQKYAPQKPAPAGHTAMGGAE